MEEEEEVCEAGVDVVLRMGGPVLLALLLAAGCDSEDDGAAVNALPALPPPPSPPPSPPWLS